MSSVSRRVSNKKKKKHGQYTEQGLERRFWCTRNEQLRNVAGIRRSASWIESDQFTKNSTRELIRRSKSTAL